MSGLPEKSERAGQARARDAKRAENGRCDVDVPDRVGDDRPATRPLARHDLGDDERDMKRRFVRENAMGHLAVLAEALAVVGSDDHERRS